MGLRIKNFNIVAVHWKIRFLEEGGSAHEKSVYKVELP